MKIDDLSEYRYVPGSVKKEIKNYVFEIYKLSVFSTKETRMRISFSPEKKYTHLVFSSWHIRSTTDPDYLRIKDEFEELVGRIYARLGHGQ